MTTKNDDGPQAQHQKNTGDAQIIDDKPVGVPSSLSDEIDGAIEEVSRSSSDDSDKNLPPDKAQSDDDKGGDQPPEPDGDVTEDDDGNTDAVLSDDQLERAVKAGMTLADAKAFKDTETLDRMCAMLEAKHESDKAKSGDVNADAQDDIVAALDAIPELDRDEYDETLVDVVDALKGLVRKQQDVIRGLQSGAKTQENWIDREVGGLGKEYSESIGVGPRANLPQHSPQALKRAELEDKVAVLEAGYKAAGKDMGRDAIFKEAVSLVLGDVAKGAADANLAAKLESRQKHHIARPGANRGTPKTDAFEDVAEEIDRKHFERK